MRYRYRVPHDVDIVVKQGGGRVLVTTRPRPRLLMTDGSIKVALGKFCYGLTWTEEATGLEFG